MRILVDTNVLFSALLFPKSVPSEALKHVVDNHDLFLCKQNVEELREIIARKAPEYLPSLADFLAALPFTLISDSSRSKTTIRDETDQPIIDAAINALVDIIITGDKDFLAMELPKPKCITPKQYLEAFAS